MLCVFVCWSLYGLFYYDLVEMVVKVCEVFGVVIVLVWLGLVRCVFVGI